jgi:protein-tyrosine phosphatase
VAEGDLLRAARVIALKKTEHQPWMTRLHPAWRNRIEYWEINDLDASTPEVALAAIEAHVTALLAELEAKPPSGAKPKRRAAGSRQ